VGWRRRLAVAAGFVGALIVIRPSYGVFGPIALLPLAAASLFAVYLLLNRRLARFDTPLTMQFSAGVAGTLTMTLLLPLGAALGEENLTPSAGDAWAWTLMASIGLLATFGHLMVVQAFRAAPASLLAPFQYLEIVSATILGYALFGDFPDPWKWLGIAIIVASGVYVFWRESRRR
jgi:drug/metabolite transporter (DMT)-like permease